jgi:hypothetical protein
VEADDFVLTQILAALHLDHDQLHQSGVFEAMRVACGDVGRLVGISIGYSLPDRRLRLCTLGDAASEQQQE